MTLARDRCNAHRNDPLQPVTRDELSGVPAIPVTARSELPGVLITRVGGAWDD